MSVEINQPADIEPPSPGSFDMELDWRKIRQQRLRVVAPQFGLDVSKLVIGQILTCIIDGGNMVTWINFGFKSATGRDEYRRLVERLAWEIGTPELPAGIKTILGKEKAAIEELDGGDEASFKEVSLAYFSARAETIAPREKRSRAPGSR